MEKLDINIKSSMLWQLQHIVKNSTSAKFANVALQEIEKTFDKPHEEEYRRHLIKFLFRSIDFQNNKQKDTGKLNLLKPNLTKAMENSNFLLTDIYVFMPEIK